MRRHRLIAALCGLALLLSGCWDLREMNHLALVMAVGIDKAETPGRIQVTIQVARPSAESKGSGPSQGGKPVYIATADGDTIFAAIRNLAQFTSRRIMWAHNNIVIVGESLAQEDITPVIDFFTRNQELRMRTWVAIARGSRARDIVTTSTGMEDIPGISLSALLRYAELPGEAVRSELGDVLHAFLAPDDSPVIAALELRPRSLTPTNDPEQAERGLQAVLSGTAIFKHTRLVGYTERDVGRGLLWIRRQMNNAVLSIPCPKGSKSSMAVEVRRPKINVRSSINGQTPTLHFEIETLAWLSEQDCPTPQFGTLELKRYAQDALAKEIAADVKDAVQFLQQELKTDGGKFARVLHTQQPAWWRMNRSRWQELFPKVKATVAVRVKIRKMSLFTRPMVMGEIRSK
ncbi:MAG TPA: Ger(x)C family spore germination protein [Symbiobacteriaceae bacterium]|nr:Ger(x)C family spore germination protein [Symbiobacteriaceae bacterium]